MINLGLIITLIGMIAVVATVAYVVINDAKR